MAAIAAKLRTAGFAAVEVVGSLVSSFFSSISFFDFSDSVLFEDLTSHPRFSTGGLDVSTFVFVGGGGGAVLSFSLSLGSVFFDKFNFGRSPLLLLLGFGTGAPRPQAPAAPLCVL